MMGAFRILQRRHGLEWTKIHSGMGTVGVSAADPILSILFCNYLIKDMAGCFAGGQGSVGKPKLSQVLQAMTIGVDHLCRF